jgi:hypothetical protein
MKAEAHMGTFILTGCLIEYLAGFRYCKEKDSTRIDYINFVNNYLNSKYNRTRLFRKR